MFKYDPNNEETVDQNIQCCIKELQHNAFGLLPENIIFLMLKTDKLKVREGAIKMLSIK